MSRWRGIATTFWGKAWCGDAHPINYDDEYVKRTRFGRPDVASSVADSPPRYVYVQEMARMGKFSSRRTIRQYAEEIWGITPVRSERARNEPQSSTLRENPL
ncbi:MAG: hypothetical protein ACREIY_01740 [Candidatus Rokuibacteriota bacterium]